MTKHIHKWKLYQWIHPTDSLKGRGLIGTIEWSSEPHLEIKRWQCECGKTKEDVILVKSFEELLRAKTKDES